MKKILSVNDEKQKKGCRALLSDREAEQDRQGAKGKGTKQDIRLIAETPIIVTLDGKEITRVVNKRIFEASDALI